VQAFAPVNADRGENSLGPRPPPTSFGWRLTSLSMTSLSMNWILEYELDPNDPVECRWVGRVLSEAGRL